METKAERTGGRGSIAVFISLLTGALLTVLIACAALSLAPTVVGALQPSPTLPALQSWAEVEIAKPTPTAEPLPTPTVVPTEMATEDVPAPEVAPAEPTSAMTMTIVEEDASVVSPQEDQAPDYSGGKSVQVSVGEQHLYAYENGALVFSFVASTGMGNSTRYGTFHVLDKIPNAYGANWNIWMPNWLGIYYSGTLENGIHALPILPGGARLWSGFLGTPISYGCVVLGVNEAQQLYDWVDIGTPVEIHW